MALRRRLPEIEPEPPSKLDRFRRDLAIDKDDLEECLIRQPELLDHVAEAHQQAVAAKDATKLDLEEAEAEAAQTIRDRATQMEEKLTEGSLKEQLFLNSNLRKLRRLQVEQKATADSWAVLKESFIQRSYMLTQLAPMHTARLFGSGNAVRVQAADVIKDRIDQERNKRGFRSDR